MREFWSKFKTLVEVYFSNPALFWAGFTLTIVFAIVGMIVSIKIWLKACGDMYSLLTLIELQQLDEEIQLRIVIADNWLAVRFLDNWFQEELNRQKRGKHYE